MLSPRTIEQIEALATEMAAMFLPPELIVGCEVLSVADKDQYAANNGWVEARVGRHNQQRCRWRGQFANVQVGDFVDVLFFASYRLFVVLGLGGTAAIPTLGGWPFAHVWSVSTTDPNADYSDIPSAIAAASAGDGIWLDDETFSLAAPLTINKAITLFSDGGAIITSSISPTIDCTVAGVALRNLQLVGTDLAPTVVNAKDTVIDNCRLTGPAGTRAIYDNAGSAYSVLRHCHAGGKVQAGTGKIIIEAGRVTGQVDGANAYMIAPILENLTLLNSPKGFYFDTSGHHYSAPNTKLTFGNGATTPPLNVTERSSAPSTPATEDIYLDDGTNTDSGNPGFRRYTGSAWEDVGGGGATVYPVKNRLYHSLTHPLWQEGTSFTNKANDSYFADVWNLVHNATTAPNITQITTTGGGAIDNALAWPRITGQEAAKQAGIVQFLENKDTVPLRDKVVSISFEAYGSGVSALRAAVLSWTGTADSLTSDVVGTWGTANPTLATNWAYANTPAADINISAGFPTRFTVENIAIPDGATNLAVFIWTPATFGSGDYFDVRNVQLEIGATATDFVPRIYQQELALVQRFLPTLPGHTGDRFLAAASSATNTYASVDFKTTPRVAPTGATVSNVSSFSVWNNNNGSSGAATAISMTVAGNMNAMFGVTTTAGSPTLAAGDLCHFYMNNANALIIFTGCRL